MHDQLTLGLGFCECGCGRQTRVAEETSRRDGTVKGRPLRFVHGHNKRRPAADRFWEKVDKAGPVMPGMDTPCWVWTGAIGGGDYGYFMVVSPYEGHAQRAHRVAYELLVGPIPDGLVLDHLCFNTRCVNPTHLEPVTQYENVMRGRGHIAAQMRALRDASS